MARLADDAFRDRWARRDQVAVLAAELAGGVDD
jgi:hypothetical protein